MATDFVVVPARKFAFRSLLQSLTHGITLDHHLEAGEPYGRPNSRNGYGAKTVLTGTGKLDLQVPRDRLASFDPQLIAKDQRRFPGFDEKIVSMYARGMIGVPTERPARWGAPHARDPGASARTLRPGGLCWPGQRDDRRRP
jgi:hypothetical protein